jgi:hypothetical protein
MWDAKALAEQLLGEIKQLVVEIRTLRQELAARNKTTTGGE